MVCFSVALCAKQIPGPVVCSSERPHGCLTSRSSEDGVLIGLRLKGLFSEGTAG